MDNAAREVGQSRGRILVVDDEPNARTALADLLADEGYAVAAAADGFKALDRLVDFAPDLVLTDLKMPGMDGLQLMARIRQQDADLPVVVMSAFGDLNTVAGSIRAGAQHYLRKPVNLTQLTAVVAKQLEQVEQRRHRPDRR